MEFKKGDNVKIADWVYNHRNSTEIIERFSRGMKKDEVCSVIEIVEVSNGEYSCWLTNGNFYPDVMLELYIEKNK